MATLNSTLVLSLRDRITAPLRGISAQLAAFQARNRAMMAPLTGITGRLALFGAGYLGATAGINGTIGAAIDFESAFADVRKVLDANEEQLANVRREIIGMSRELPIAASGIAEIYAAAGQANIPIHELGRFSEMVAKVATAWEVPVGETGQALAEIKNQLQLNVRDIGLVADAINHLSNTSAARAPDLVDFTKRVAGTGEMYGFSAAQTLAFGGSMIAVGAQSEVAATSFRNMGRALTIGARATKMQREAFKKLGIDSIATAKGMQKDALNTTLNVIERIQKLPEWQRISIASALFGDEARALMPLINNSAELRRQLGLVASESNYAGSAFKEYVTRADTVGNLLQILRNKFADLFRGIGDDMLPSLKEAALGIGDVLDTLGSRATIFDQLSTAVEGFVQGLGYNGGVREAINDLADLLFGEADGSAAADRLGRIFVQFREWGVWVREFADAVKDNPVAKFLGSLAGHGFQFAIATLGISMLAGAIRSLAVGLAMVSGASAAISILKTLAGIGGAIFGAAGKAAGGAAAGAAGTAAAGGGGAALAATSKEMAVAAVRWIAGNPAAIAAIGGVLGVGLLGRDATADQRDPAARDYSEGYSQEENAARNHKMWHGVPFEGGMHRAGLGAGPQPGAALPQTKGELPSVIKTEPTGVQDVNVTNMRPPPPNVYVTVHAQTNADPNAMGAAIGAHVKSAIESTYSDGGI